MQAGRSALLSTRISKPAPLIRAPIAATYARASTSEVQCPACETKQNLSVNEHVNMVRSLSQWTKTLSFPSRLSPNRASKESVVNVQPASPGVSPTPSASSLPQSSEKTITPIPITEISQIIYPDPESEKAIMGSVVYCIHHKEGCQWSDELRKLKAHLNTCKHDAVLCAAQCGAMIPRVLMQDHLRYTCPRRRANCEHCGKEFSGSALEEHQGNCGHEPVYCENKCGAKVQRRHTQQHMLQHCSKRLVPCRHCSQRYTQDTVCAHGATCARAPVPCPQRCATASVPRDELDAHLREHCAATGQPCGFRDAGCRFKGTRQALERHTEESCQQHLALVSSLASRQARQLDSLRAAVARLSVNCSGALVWRISDWAAKMAEAKCKDGVELVSPTFYTSQYGYKLQASLFLNGNGAGEGTHISVYIKILPGEYDALLRWPFAHTVSFTLFDQSASPERACNIVESFVPDPTWKNFQRPSREPDALGFGFPRFVSHEMLKKRSFVKDDVMFLRVKVDPSKIVAV